jgi:hypothetical protein
MPRKQVNNPEVRFVLKSDEQSRLRLLPVLASLALTPPDDVDVSSEQDEDHEDSELEDN